MKALLLLLCLTHSPAPTTHTRTRVQATELRLEPKEGEQARPYCLRAADVATVRRVQRLFAQGVEVTALCDAAREGRVEDVARLLRGTEHVERADSRGRTPLSHAVAAEQLDAVGILLAAGAAPEAELHRAMSPGDRDGPRRPPSALGAASRYVTTAYGGAARPRTSSPRTSSHQIAPEPGPAWSFKGPEYESGILGARPMLGSEGFNRGLRARPAE